MKINFKAIAENVLNFLQVHVRKITADTLNWTTAIILHCATLPNLIAIISGLSDKMPDLEIILFIWSALTLLFARAIILRDRLNIITIGAGFITQAVLMALIMFK
jgi:hypothetical protein